MFFFGIFSYFFEFLKFFYDFLGFLVNLGMLSILSFFRDFKKAGLIFKTIPRISIMLRKMIKYVTEHIIWHIIHRKTENFCYHEISHFWSGPPLKGVKLRNLFFHT